ncbi:MAG: inositol monophosphatase family protein [Paracoccaceae bacterium]
MPNQSATITVMIQAARKAAKSLLKDFAEVEHLQASTKSPGDFVSKADLKAESIIRYELEKARPYYGWVGEESEEVIGKDPTRRWIVDPLDGTSNFLHGVPHWAISIALEHKDEITTGVIYDPIKDECFYAEKGNGAWLNDKRLRVSGRNQMIEMLFSTGIPFANKPDLSLTLKEIETIMPKCSGLRRNGSAALDLAYVAAGRFDGYWERGLNSWDMAAGIIIVKESGGIICSLKKEGNPIFDGSILASSDKIFEEFSKMILI